MKKNIYVSFALNLAIFLLMIFAISCELFDFHFMTDGTFLEKQDFSTFGSQVLFTARIFADLSITKILTTFGSLF